MYRDPGPRPYASAPRRPSLGLRVVATSLGLALLVLGIALTIGDLKKSDDTHMDLVVLPLALGIACYGGDLARRYILVRSTAPSIEHRRGRVRTFAGMTFAFYAFGCAIVFLGRYRPEPFAAGLIGSVGGIVLAATWYGAAERRRALFRISMPPPPPTD